MKTLIAVLLCCAWTGLLEAAPKKSEMQIKRERRVEWMRITRLHKRDPARYYAEYIRGKYYMENGSPEMIVLLDGKAFQKVADGVLFSGGRITDAGMDYAGSLFYVYMDADRVTLDTVYDMQPMRPAGTYDYITIRGERASVPAYVYAVTIDYAQYMEMREQGVIFPGEPMDPAEIARLK